MGYQKNHQFIVGDIVLLSRGYKTKFYEVIKIEDDYMWVSNGWVQATKKFDEVELICKVADRQDSKVPSIPFINC